jgi:integrase
MFLTLIHTGVRSGECAGLKWGDIDMAGKFLIIRRSIGPDGKENKTKTDRIRRIDMSDELISALVRHRKEALEKALKEKRSLYEFVFANKEGNAPDMHNLKNRVFHTILDKAKLRRIRLHDLRHTYASLMISAGISPAYVQQQLGHASIKMTVDTYTHLIPGANRDATNVLPGLTTIIEKAAAQA